jgi:Rad3-related DNA helicase
MLDTLLPSTENNTNEDDTEGWMPPPEVIAEWRSYFPMPEFRQYQEAVIEGIIKGWASGKRFAVVEGPTGSGKSSWAITLGRLFGNAFLCTPQKMLQNQYMNDFPTYLFELKGRSTYPCLRVNHEEWQHEGSSTDKKDKKKNRNNPRDPVLGVDYLSFSDWNLLPEEHIWRKHNCANAPCTTKKNGTILKKECKKHGVCEYIKRRDYALKESPFSVLNFSNMILFSRHMPKVYAKRPLLILDESHSLESFLYEYASVSVTLKKLSPLRPFTGDVLDRLRDSFG